jgi:hypothetical protein
MYVMYSPGLGMADGEALMMEQPAKAAAAAYRNKALADAPKRGPKSMKQKPISNAPKRFKRYVELSMMISLGRLIGWNG